MAKSHEQVRDISSCMVILVVLTLDPLVFFLLDDVANATTVCLTVLPIDV